MRDKARASESFSLLEMPKRKKKRGTGASDLESMYEEYMLKKPLI